jgi:hypothetical protein
MAQLGEVLGSMLTDVVRARMAADMVTAQAVETYRTEPALASMAVPRVTVSNLTVKLTFAVSAMPTPPPAALDLRRARAEWTTRLEDRVAPTLPPLRPRPSGLAAEGPQLREVPVDAGDLDAGLGGDVGPLVAATVSHLMEGRGRIPKIERDELVAEVRQHALAFVDAVRQQQFADVANRSSMDVEVVTAKVSEAPAEALQSLEVTFSVDDLEEILTVPGEWR